MKRQTFIKHQKLVICLFTVMFIFSLLSVIKMSVYKPVSVATDITNTHTIVIDPGHGGEDGGAVGISGAVEKFINFSISLELKKLLDFCGIDCVMTRSEDILLYSVGEESRKKYFDVRNRVKITNSVENPVLVSIHQNKFPIEKYSGLQVYYSPNNSDSKIIAENIQNINKKYLQTENNRAVKEAGRNIFLLNNLDCPAVLVECGFLSNSYEEQLLINEEYQRKLAFVMFKSISEYIIM